MKGVRMAVHAFVDESKKRDYIVAAAVVAAQEIAAARRAMRGLRIGKQQRIHFKDEADARKRRIVTVALDVSIDYRVYVCRTSSTSE